MPRDVKPAVTHLLFDFFGTLVDYSDSRTEQGYPASHHLLIRAGAELDYAGFLKLWSTVAEEFDRAADQSTREFSMSEVVRAFLSRMFDSAPSETLVGEFVDLYLSEWNRGVRYPEGIQQLLGRLAERFELAIITNTHDPMLVPRHLSCMGVAELFRDVVTSVEYGLRKPNPAIFQHTLKLLGVSAERCLYVGDNFEADYQGALSAGIRPVLIDPDWRHPVPNRDRVRSILALDEILPRVS